MKLELINKSDVKRMGKDVIKFEETDLCRWLEKKNPENSGTAWVGGENIDKLIKSDRKNYCYLYFQKSPKIGNSTSLKDN